MPYLFYELDDFTGESSSEPLTELSDDAREHLGRIADQISAFYRITDKATGDIILERRPMRRVAGRQMPVVDLFYGVLVEGQRDSLFRDDGKPDPAAFRVAEDLVRVSTALPVLGPGQWVPQDRPGPPARTELDLAPLGRIDYETPCATVRVNFIRPERQI